MCRERLHILSSSGDNLCKVRQNVPLRVHILSPATNCAGATKCAVTAVSFLHIESSAIPPLRAFMKGIIFFLH